MESFVHQDLRHRADHLQVAGCGRFLVFDTRNVLLPVDVSRGGSLKTHVVLKLVLSIVFSGAKELSSCLVMEGVDGEQEAVRCTLATDIERLDKVCPGFGSSDLIYD